jgi:hypothetical protein
MVHELSAHPQHVKVVKHLMSLTMKWKPSWMGQQPQQQQYAVVSPSGRAQNSGQLPKAWLLILTGIRL